MFLRFICFCLFFSASSVLFAQDEPKETKPPEKVNNRPAEKPEPSPEPYDNATVDEMTRCVVLQTAKGDIEIEMFPFIAPNTVRNFLNLSAIGAFENTTFSRVVPDFVIQGGNLYSNKNITYEMSVRAHKKLADEPNQIKHERGIISMAKGEEPNSAATSFFILVRSAPSLDNNFAAFGRVVKGMDVVDVINGMPVDDETPKEPVLISKASIKACEILTEKPAMVEPPKAPKVNDLPRFGFRGRVKNVRESNECKSAATPVRCDVLYEFGESGNLIKMTVSDKNGDILTSLTRETRNAGKGEWVIREIQQDSSGAVMIVREFVADVPGIFTFKDLNRDSVTVRQGKLHVNEEGRILKEIIESSNDGNNNTSSHNYDAYGFVTSLEKQDDSGKRIFFNRYEYTVLDDRANWTVRLVFDSEDSDKPVRSVKRVFEYYEEN